jgi:hypothetical protein
MSEKKLPEVQVGQRFTADVMDRFQAVALVRKLPTTWLVAAIRPDGWPAHLRLTMQASLEKTSA